MAGFRIPTPDGFITVQARQQADGAWVQEVAVQPARRTPVASPEKLSVGTGAIVQLSPPGGANHGILVPETNDIRKYEDGTNPTTGLTGNGTPITVGNYWELDLKSFTGFKMIGRTATATVHVEYWRFGD